MCVNVCSTQVWPKYATCRAASVLCDYTYHDGVSANYSVFHPAPFKRPLNPVKPTLAAWKEENPGRVWRRTPPPRWDPIEGTNDRCRLCHVNTRGNIYLYMYLSVTGTAWIWKVWLQMCGCRRRACEFNTSSCCESTYVYNWDRIIPLPDLFMLPITEWKLITHQPHIDGIS